MTTTIEAYTPEGYRLTISVDDSSRIPEISKWLSRNGYRPQPNGVPPHASVTVYSADGYEVVGQASAEDIAAVGKVLSSEGFLPHPPTEVVETTTLEVYAVVLALKANGSEECLHLYDSPTTKLQFKFATVWREQLAALPKEIKSLYRWIAAQDGIEVPSQEEAFFDGEQPPSKERVFSGRAPASAKTLSKPVTVRLKRTLREGGERTPWRLV